MIHVYKVSEEAKHDLSETTTCNCGATLSESDHGEMIVVHKVWGGQLLGWTTQAEIDALEESIKTDY